MRATGGSGTLHGIVDRYEMEWENPPMLWDQFSVAPELYYGQSYPPEQIERRAARLKEARHGTAVSLFRAADDAVPVGIVLAAFEGELVAPVVGWDGVVRQVNLVRSGEAPRLGAGQASVLHFWHGGVECDVRFRVELRYGPDARPAPEEGERSLHARRHWGPVPSYEAHDKYRVIRMVIADSSTKRGAQKRAILSLRRRFPVVKKKEK